LVFPRNGTRCPGAKSLPIVPDGAAGTSMHEVCRRPASATVTGCGAVGTLMHAVRRWLASVQVTGCVWLAWESLRGGLGVGGVRDAAKARGSDTGYVVDESADYQVVRGGPAVPDQCLAVGELLFLCGRGPIVSGCGDGTSVGCARGEAVPLLALRPPPAVLLGDRNRVHTGSPAVCDARTEGSE